MKKIAILILILITSIFSGCSGNPNISYANSSISIEVGSYYTINPKDINTIDISSPDISYSIHDSKIASITNATIKGESIGITTLTITARKWFTQISTTVEIRVIPVIIRASTATLKPSITLNLQNQYTFNKLTLASSTGAKVNEVPIVTITPSIATYDYITGKFTGISTGECVVTINFVKCSATFTATIYDHIYVDTLIVNGLDNNSTIGMYNNTSGKLDYTLTPTTANTFSFSSDSPLISIDNKGNYTTLNTGIATINLNYSTNITTNIKMTFYINIVEKVENIDIEILTTSMGGLYNNTINKYIGIKEKDYILRVITDTPIEVSKLSIPTSIDIKGDWSTNETTYTIPIAFKNIGRDDFYLEYVDNLYGVNNNITTNVCDITVYSVHNLIVEVRYNLLDISNNTDSYTIYQKPEYIDTISAMTYIDYVTYLDTEKQILYQDDVKSYVDIGGVPTLIQNNTFSSSDYTASITPYTISIIALSIPIKTISVTVASVDISTSIDYPVSVDYSQNTIDIDLDIINNFDDTIYTVDNLDIRLEYEDNLSSYISTTNNVITLNNYTDSIIIEVYYKDVYIDTITINIINN